MTIDPLYGFVFLGLFSPGPNVILLTASGARFGFRRTLPHILGVAAGVGVTSALTGLGIASLLFRVPALEMALRLAAFAWILWMAKGLAFRKAARGVQAEDRPFTFLQAVLFQWVNPKVWAVALAAAAGYSAGLTPGQEALRLGTAFSTINLGVCLFWAGAGGLLALLLTTPRAWRLFNLAMAGLLALSGLAVFL
jgi:threonine/homoserine/homoserine lactone efflux protein